MIFFSSIDLAMALFVHKYVLCNSKEEKYSYYSKILRAQNGDKDEQAYNYYVVQYELW